MKVITTKPIGNIPAGSQGIKKGEHNNAWSVKITHKNMPENKCTPFELSLGFWPKSYFKYGSNCP